MQPPPIHSQASLCSSCFVMAGQLKLARFCSFVCAPRLPSALPACEHASRASVCLRLQTTPITLRQFVNTGFQVLFHSPPGVLFTFPSQYYALSVTKKYLALRGGPRSFHQGSTCLDVLWIPPCQLSFRVRGFHPLWPAFPKPFC